MIPRHPTLSVELRSEADDLRRYARELDQSGDIDAATQVREQAMHVDGWVSTLDQLEADVEELSATLASVEEVHTPAELRAWIDERAAAAELEADFIAECLPPVYQGGRIVNHPAKGATLSTVQAKIDEIASALEDGESEGLEGILRAVKTKVAKIRELEEIITREVRADALDRIAELERDNANLRAELKAAHARIAELERRPSLSPLTTRKAAWLDEILDRCALPRFIVEDVYRLLDSADPDWDNRAALLGSLSKALAAAAAPASAAPASVVLDARPLEAALEAEAAAVAAVAGLNADHPLQLAYEAELEAELRRAKPKAKIPKRDGGRLDVPAASAMIAADVSAMLLAKYGAQSSTLRLELRAAMAEAKARVVEARAALAVSAP